MRDRYHPKSMCEDVPEYIHNRNVMCSAALLEALNEHHGVPIVVQPVPEPESVALPPIPNEMMARAHAEPGIISIRDIQLIVCKEFDILHADMLSGRRKMKYVLPRHVAIYLAKKMTKLSFPMIARRFGNMDHSSCCHAVDRIEEKYASNPELATRINKIEERLGGLLA